MDTFAIQCPQCNKSLKATTKMAGKQFHCPRCGTPLIVPGASEDQPAVSERPAVNSTAGQDAGGLAEPETQWLTATETDPAPLTRRRTAAMFLGSFLLVGLLAAVVCVVVFVAVKGKTPAQKTETDKSGKKASPASERSPFESARDPEFSKSDTGRAMPWVAGGVAVGVLVAAMILAVVYCLFVLWMMVWVAKDASNRGMESALWAIIYISAHLGSASGTLYLPALSIWLIPAVVLVVPIAWVVSWSGLFIYLLARRKGQLLQCAHCPNYRLEYVQSCPHCGRAA